MELCSRPQLDARRAAVGRLWLMTAGAPGVHEGDRYGALSCKARHDMAVGRCSWSEAALMRRCSSPMMDVCFVVLFSRDVRAMRCQRDMRLAVWSPRRTP